MFQMLALGNSIYLEGLFLINIDYKFTFFTNNTNIEKKKILKIWKIDF